MPRKSLVALTALAGLTLGTTAFTRNDPPPAGKLIVVKMVDISATEYKYSPASVVAAPGDTIRFEQTTVMPHNVEFRDVPAGSTIDGIKTGPFLTSAGEKYDVVIDGRFAAGVYNFVCTPHEAMGMKGSFTVKK
ncbi:MAG: plastocyanin/azurin family copper-binding protein [Gemmatimonadales bacterium]